MGDELMAMRIQLFLIGGELHNGTRPKNASAFPQCELWQWGSQAVTIDSRRWKNRQRACVCWQKVTQMNDSLATGSPNLFFT